MEGLSDPKYINLREKYEYENKAFKAAEKALRKSMFGRLDQELSKFEDEAKQEFLEIWKENGNPHYSFDKLKFAFSPLNDHNYAIVMAMSNSYGASNDLEEVSKMFPEEKRVPEFLESQMEYRQISHNIKSNLEHLDLGPDWGEIKPISDFRSKFNILMFKPGYFQKE